MKGLFTTLTILVLLASTFCASADSRRSFIRRYRNLAIEEMERTGIPASITLAQGILESSCGKSELAVNANNYFGIKCHNWTGATYTMDDDAKDECFRKYEHPEQSWIDHSEFLISRPRYAGLFELRTTDYRAWAKGLKAAGYATDPKYAHKLIGIIEEEGLSRYDRQIRKPSGEAPDYSRLIGKHTQPVSNPFNKREEIRNGIPCLEALDGDSFEKIASAYGIRLKKLLQYNDRSTTDLQPGEIVFLKNKKSKAARGYAFHRVKSGETLYGISQRYGIRMKNLKKYNYILEDVTLQKGEKLYLRKKAELY